MSAVLRSLPNFGNAAKRRCVPKAAIGSIIRSLRGRRLGKAAAVDQQPKAEQSNTDSSGETAYLHAGLASLLAMYAHASLPAFDPNRHEDFVSVLRCRTGFSDRYATGLVFEGGSHQGQRLLRIVSSFGGGARLLLSRLEVRGPTRPPGALASSRARPPLV
jgi:hypothetical protein